MKRIITGVVFCLWPFFILAQQPTVIDVFNSNPYQDENGATLEDGDVIHVIWTGLDNNIDPPVLTIGQPNSGQPTGDDQLLEVHAVGENFPPGFGQFSFAVDAYPDGDALGRRPQAGDTIYVRAFNSNDTQTATHYDDAQIYVVQGVNGEDYDPIINMNDTDVSLPVELSSFIAIGGNREVILKWATSSEVNNLGFILKRSDSEDGAFQEVASYKSSEELKGAGSTNGETEYMYRDKYLVNGKTYWYKLIDVDFNGQVNELKTLSVTPSINNDQIMQGNYIPDQFQLKQNFPNPFNPETRIEIHIPNEETGITSVSVYNALGQKVRTLLNSYVEPGVYYLVWDGKADSGQILGSGIYFYMLKNNNFHGIKKMLLVR